jgi:hypothetical protein
MPLHHKSPAHQDQGGDKDDPGAWRSSPAEVRFGVHVRNNNCDRTPPLVRLKPLCGLGDNGEQVVTVMLPTGD